MSSRSVKNNNHNDDISFFMQQQQPIMIPLKNDKIVRNYNPVFYQKDVNSIKQQNDQVNHSNSNVINSRNTIKGSTAMNILKQNKMTMKFEINQQFINLLSDSYNNPDMGIVSFLGSKKMGKSFLVDCLISNQQKKINRQMIKNSKNLINMPSCTLQGRNQQKILLFDCNGTISSQLLLWVYFLSSTVIFNLNPYNRADQQDFLKSLAYLKLNLTSHFQDLSLPKLIILKRDSQNKYQQHTQFIKRIKQYNLFQNQITFLHFNYPGSQKVNAQQIIDVPQSFLNKSFLNDVIDLSNLIKSTSKAKLIQGNVIGSKILSLIIDPLTRNINKDKKVNTIKIWQDVIQTLSIGYYNYYILKYNQQLQKQFQDQKPYDKYTLYKKLNTIKRRINKKIQGFNSIMDDPIFEKYRQKLNQKINSKQKMIKQINKQKSRKQNDDYCKTLFKDMNQSNCQKLIQQYCKSQLDQGKSQVLLENFKKIINQRLQDIQKSKTNTSKSLKSIDIKNLQDQINNIQQQILRQKQLGNKIPQASAQFNTKLFQQSIKNKQKQIIKLNKQLNTHKQLSNSKKLTQDKAITQLQNNIQSLKLQIEQQEKQIQKLRKQRKQRIIIVKSKLQNQLQEQENKLAQLQGLLRKKKQKVSINAPINVVKSEQKKKPQNNSCCLIM